MVQVKVRGDIEEISSDSDDDEPEVVPPSLKGMIEACRKLEEDCLLVGTEGALDFIEAGRRLRGHLQKIAEIAQNRLPLICSLITSRYRPAFLEI